MLNLVSQNTMCCFPEHLSNSLFYNGGQNWSSQYVPVEDVSDLKVTEKPGDSGSLSVNEEM